MGLGGMGQWGCGVSALGHMGSPYPAASVSKEAALPFPGRLLIRPGPNVSSGVLELWLPWLEEGKLRPGGEGAFGTDRPHVH